MLDEEIDTTIFDDSFKRVILRLCETRDTLSISNPAGIRLLIRYNVSDESTDLAFDLCIFADESDEHVRRAVDNDMNVIDEDTDGVFVIDEFVLDSTSPLERFADAIRLFRSLWRWRVCPCGDYFVKDADTQYTICLRCDLLCGKNRDVLSTCPICCQQFDRLAAASLDCCGKVIDRRCFFRCKSCPFCRHPLNHPDECDNMANIVDAQVTTSAVGTVETSFHSDHQ